MDRNALHSAILEHTTFTFSRSGGRGGQNVNKVNTKVHAMIPVDALAGLSEAELAAALRKLQGKINGGRVLCADVDDERTQEANRRIALARLESWVAGAAYIQPGRRKTRPTRASQERRLQGKRLRSALKRSRKPIFGE